MAVLHPETPAVVAPTAADAGPPLPRGCTFEPDDWRIVARHWYPVATVDEVGAAPVGVTLLDQPLVVYRPDGPGGAPVVAVDLCPHRGVPLSLGTPDPAGGVRCAYHGFRFGAQGRCTAIPAHPDARIPERMHLRTVPAVERYGLIWTCLAAGPDDEPVVPAHPHWDDEGFQRIVCPWIDIAGFAGRQVEGFLDVAHFSFVHLASFGDPDNATVPEYTTRTTPEGFEAHYWSSVHNFPKSVPNTAPPGFSWLRHYRTHLPFTATLVVHFPEGGRLAIMNAASPVSARRTRMFAPIARNFNLEQPVHEVHEFNRTVFEEDRAIVEVQKPENLPLDPRIEVNVPADRSSVAYRRGLRAMGLSTFFTA